MYMYIVYFVDSTKDFICRVLQHDSWLTDHELRIFLKVYLYTKYSLFTHLCSAQQLFVLF